MNKTKILSTITLTVAFILIITGYSIMFIDGYKVDAQEKEDYATLIKTSFKTYNSQLETISYDIKHMDVFNTKYYEDIQKNYNKNIELLRTIEIKIREMETTSKNILYECENRDFNDNDIDYKCSVIEYNYESIINAYVSLINKYNDKFTSYNTWVNDKEKELSMYSSKYYRNFIDINSDGENSGIIE